MKAINAAIFILSSFFVVGAWGQEHAPTLDQCRADRDLWIYQLKSSSTGREELRKSLADINSNLLWARQVEMMNCMTAIDPMPSETTDWASVTRENFSDTVLANQRQILDRDKWDKYMLLRLVYAEEIEERLMALLKTKN